MVHLRIVVPGPKSERVVGLLEASPSVSSLARIEGASRKPPGDLVLCDVAREEASVVIDDLRELDYVVGSVHFVGDRAVDHEGWDAWETAGDPEKVWQRYFETLAECARSGLFDILAHPDLVKVWGRARPLPERDPRHFYEPAVEAIAESGIAVEVSTAGLRKPVGEIYPAPAFAAMCVEAGAPFALSSDAHLPEQVGFGYDRALELFGELGVGEICVFEGRERRLVPLGAEVGENQSA